MHLLGTLEGSEGTWHMDQSTLEMTWAQAGQVDLFWTKIGGKYLMLGLKIEIKVIGNGLLVERTG